MRLKKERNAVLLAHYYQDSDIQDVADFIGDSLQLAQAAEKTKADVIFFAGVHFMAETAKILNPERIVVVPDMQAGCSLADGCPADRFGAWRAKHPGAVVVSYINCSAEVKAASDYICTSSNAEKIVRAHPGGQEILFAPDKNLGRWLDEEDRPPDAPLAGQLHRPRDVQRAERSSASSERHPDAQVIAHPECEEPVLAHGRLHRIDDGAPQVRDREPDATEFIVVDREPGIVHQMRKAAPAQDVHRRPAGGATARATSARS